jgi:hypothetical protein
MKTDGHKEGNGVSGDDANAPKNGPKLMTLETLTV